MSSDWREQNKNLIDDRSFCFYETHDQCLNETLSSTMLVKVFLTFELICYTSSVFYHALGKEEKGQTVILGNVYCFMRHVFSYQTVVHCKMSRVLFRSSRNISENDQEGKHYTLCDFKVENVQADVFENLF